MIKIYKQNEVITSGTVAAMALVAANKAEAAATEAEASAHNTYETASGTSNAITLTSITNVANKFTTFIAIANNNGTATTINGIPFYSPNTTNAPTVIAGKAYTIWYNATNNCFFIKASAEGSATADKVLATDTFSNGVDIGIQGTIPSKLSATITPGTTDQVISAGQYLAGAQTIKGDADLIASNIINTANIYDIQGTAIPYQLVAGNTYTLKEYTGMQTTSDTNHHFHAMGITTNIAGTIRISFTMVADTVTYGYGQIFKNGVAIGTARTVYQTSETFVEDFSCVQGNYFQLDYQKSGVNTASITNFKVMATLNQFVT